MNDPHSAGYHPRWEDVESDTHEPVRFRNPVRSTSNRISLARTNPEWIQIFSARRAQLMRLHGVLEVHHVGSTSVPGVPAKPIIDIDIVADYKLISTTLTQFIREGLFLTLHEPFWHEHYLLKNISATLNVHVFPNGCIIPDRDTNFRNLLKSSSSLAAEYTELKRKLARQEWASVNDYAHAKSLFIVDALKSSGYSAVCNCPPTQLQETVPIT